MPVHKVILRLDYKVQFDILEAPGTTLKLLNEGVPADFWNSYGDNRESRQVTATFKDDPKAPREVRYVAVDPTATSAMIESTRGLELATLLTEDALALVLQRVTALCEKFHLVDLVRLGFRIFYLSRLGEPGAPLKAFSAAINDAFADPVKTTLGAASDVGLAWDGAADDKIQYHFRCGPYFETEHKKYFDNLDEASLRGDRQPNFIADLDLYEANFSLAKLPLAKWLKPMVTRQSNLINRVEAAVTKLSEG